MSKQAIARLRRAHYFLSEWFADKNANAPEGKHFDMEVGDYVDNNCDEGYHWSMDAYRCVPDEG